MTVSALPSSKVILRAQNFKSPKSLYPKLHVQHTNLTDISNMYKQFKWDASEKPSKNCLCTISIHLKRTCIRTLEASPTSTAAGRWIEKKYVHFIQCFSINLHIKRCFKLNLGVTRSDSLTLRARKANFQFTKEYATLQHMRVLPFQIQPCKVYHATHNSPRMHVRERKNKARSPPVWSAFSYRRVKRLY